MMVHLFGYQGYPGHKGKSFGEIPEFKFFVEFVA
jgi:hypothetical protein